MMSGNGTKVTEFILLGFGDSHHFHIHFFLAFLIIYIVTITGNILIVALVVFDRHLHTPMYFFLGNLAILEACSSTNILPRMLTALQTGNRKISFSSCFAQWYICSSSLLIECCLLCVMSYDRYLAICKPLHYTTIMNIQNYIRLAAASWINGFAGVVPLLTLLLKTLHFCGPNVIDHYFCDLIPLRKLSCSDSSLSEILSVILGAIFVFLPFLLTLTSYIYIIVAILRIPSAADRQKAFSTCSSHLVVVSLFFGSIIVVYMLPKTGEMQGMEKYSSLLYIVLPPLVNPFIYSLRNKDVKNALKMILTFLSHKKQMS